MIIIKYLQDTESNCCHKEVYKWSLLLAIDFQTINTDIHICTRTHSLSMSNSSDTFKYQLRWSFKMGTSG